MSAKDWMRLYADGETLPILHPSLPSTGDATRALVRRLYPARRMTETADGTLLEQANPDDDRIYAGCFPVLTVVYTREAALDQPS